MSKKRQKPHSGRGILNTIISHLPIPLHLPGYNWCGPGTDISKNKPPINKLDSYCREHDLFYSKNPDTASRNRADLKLAEQAWERVKASDSSVGERASAYLVTNLMKAKAKLGMGIILNKKYGQFPAVKGSTKRASLQRRLHAQRIKKKKSKQKRKRNS